MKIIELDLNYREIKARIEIDKSRYGVGEWARMVGASIATVSNIHGKSAKINPSLQYIIAVARVTGKPVEWYLYGTAAAAPAKGEEQEFTCGWSEETKQACLDLKEILESGDSMVALTVLTAISVALESLRRKQENERQREEIKILKEKVRHMEKLLVPGETAAGETTGGSSGRKKAM